MPKICHTNGIKMSFKDVLLVALILTIRMLDMYKKSIIALSLLTLLSGCSLEGDDGAAGAKGATGETGATGSAGETGATGKNNNGLYDIQLVGRAVLNAQSPEGAAEIVAYQTSKQWIYAINSSGSKPSVEIMAAANLDAQTLVKNNEGVITNTNLVPAISIDLSLNTPGDANSIAISSDDKLLAVAMAAAQTGVAGQIAFYDISGDSPAFISNVTVGYLPDMVTFTPDNSKVVVANEGEPAGDYSVDPEGSVSIISIVNGAPAETATTLSLSGFNDKQAELVAQGVVFANPTGRTIKGKVINTSVAMDLEPEYITISTDSKTAYVTVQENNALLIVDLENNTLKLQGLGFKDWSQLDFDASDKDGGVHFKKYPGLYGMYQPDTIASYRWQGAEFLITANEGDGREYFFATEDEASCLNQGGIEFDAEAGCLAYIDEIRAKDLDLADNFSYLNNNNDDIGRLKVTTVLGDKDQDGRYESLYTYGARSFTIWDSNGLVVFDSGDQIDRITASIHGAAFNNDEDTNEGDTRSDAKGAEPEALAIGKVGDRTLAFIGLERMGGVLVYDVTNPYNAQFIDYFINRGLVEGADPTGDLAPEGMKFVSADHSPTGKALLIIGNEISGSVAVWQIAEK